MKTPDDKPAENTNLEYLPSNDISVDLLSPELMSVGQLREIFVRRGFGNLVSKSDPIYRLVDLYYDHVMPMPSRTTEPASEIKEPPPCDTSRPARPDPISSNRLSSINTTKRKADVRLEDIVITSDPKRHTLTGCDTNTREEPVLSVKQPNHSLIKKRSSHQTDEAPDSKGVSTVVQISNGHVESTKKRTKLKRDFSALT